VAVWRYGNIGLYSTQRTPTKGSGIINGHGAIQVLSEQSTLPSYRALRPRTEQFIKPDGQLSTHGAVIDLSLERCMAEQTIKKKTKNTDAYAHR